MKQFWESEDERCGLKMEDGIFSTEICKVNIKCVVQRHITRRSRCGNKEDESDSEKKYIRDK